MRHDDRRYLRGSPIGQVQPAAERHAVFGLECDIPTHWRLLFGNERERASAPARGGSAEGVGNSSISGGGRPIRGKPERLIGDRGYDSNAVRRFLKRRRIQPIIPARSNNTQATDQDGRCLRRYRRRWIVERTIGWLGNFRRLTVRYDRLLATYGGFFHLACALLVLKRVLK